MLGEETFHPDTRALLAYGRALAGAGAAPRKGGADHLLERIFVVERMPDGRLPVRSFGKELVTLFGRDLREYDLARFFLAPDLTLLRALIASACAAAEPAIARLRAETHGDPVIEVELLLTPLKMHVGDSERLLGMFQPLGGQAFLNGLPIARLRLGSLHPPLAKIPRGPRLAIVND